MKSLAKNSLYNIIYKCSNVIFPFVTAAWVSRILMADGIGKVSAAQNIASYFIILSTLGLPAYGTKAIAAKYESRKEQSRVFSELFIINMVSTIICTVAYYLMIFMIPYFQKRVSLFAVCGLAVPFNIINVDWYYQGKEEYRFIMIRSLVIKMVSLIACLMLVRTSDDYIVYALITTLATVLNYIFNIIHLRKYIKFENKGLNVVQHIKPVFIMFAASIAIEVYTLADTTMLMFFCNDTVVGYYSNAIKSVRGAKMLVTAVSAVFLPRLSFYYANGKKQEFDKLVNNGIKILALISIPATIGMVLLAADYVPVLFGRDFNEAISTIRILAFSIVSVAFSNFFGYQVLIAVGKEKQMMISTIIGAVVNIILNYPFILIMQQNGVALSSVITELCVAIYQIYAIRKVFEFEIDYKYMLSVIASITIMILIVIFALYYIDNEFLALIITIPVGFGCYIIMLLVTKNEFVLQLCKKLHM